MTSAEAIVPINDGENINLENITKLYALSA